MFKLKRRWWVIGAAVAACFGDVISSAVLATKGALLAGLPLVVAKLEDVPEAHRALYKEDPEHKGQFRLDVDGVEDVSGLKSALEKERKAATDANKALRELAKKYEGIDPEKHRQIMAIIDSSEEAKMIAEGKIEAVWAKRTERLQAEHKKALETVEGKVKAADERTNKYQQRVLDNHIRAAATTAGVHAQAVDDALFRARTIFVLDEEGNAVQLDENSKPILGKDGKTPLAPLEWLEGMKESAPHWYPNGNTGGGAGGDKNKNNSGAKTMKRTRFDALTPAEKASAAKEYAIID